MKNTTVAILAPAALTQTTTGTGVNVAAFHGLVDVILASSATGGAGETAVVTLEHSDEASANYTSAGVTFETVTNAAASTQAITVNVDQLKKFLRAKVTLAGDTPEVTCGVLLSGKRNYA